MPNVVLVKVKDLASGQREWVAQVFGRQPAEDEEITLMLFPAHHGSTDEERQAVCQAVWKRIGQILDKAATNARHVSDEEFESAIEEAMAHVRPH
jgi:hypothetical protein